MKPTRTCAYCGEPIHGRSDKRYCDNICKSRDFRERDKAHTTVVINNVPTSAEEPRRQELPTTAMSSAPSYVPTPEPSAPSKAEPTPVKSLTQQIDESFAATSNRIQRETLNHSYATTIKTFVDGLGRNFSLRALEEMKRQADRVVAGYMAHPSVKSKEELYLQRMDDLYLVQDALADAIALAREQPFWATKEAGYHIPDKKCRKMREHLIG